MDTRSTQVDSQPKACPERSRRAP